MYCNCSVVGSIGHYENNRAVLFDGLSIFGWYIIILDWGERLNCTEFIQWTIILQEYSQSK